MGKLWALFSLFRKGAVVADPALWKTRQIEATTLAGVLVALVQTLEAFNVTLPFNADDATVVATAVLVVVNGVLTVTTTDKVGLPAAPSDQPKSPLPGFDHDAGPMG
jgi:hypothetical protein